MADPDAVTTEDGGAPAELVPPAYDLAFSALVVVAVVLAVAALVRLARTHHDVVTGLLALALVVVIPVLGPAAYLYLTRRQDRRAAGTTFRRARPSG